MTFLYIIINQNKKLYIGVTDNPIRRLTEHNKKIGAEFTKDQGHYDIALLEEYKDLSEARKREIQLKKWSRSKKIFLIEKYRSGQDTRQKDK